MNGTKMDRGIIPRLIEHLFAAFATNRTFGWNYTLQLSCIEVYNEELYDLLDENIASKKIKTVDNSTVVEDLVQLVVPNELKMTDLFDAAINRRKTSSTLKNASSSRSHFIVQLQLTGYHSNETTISKISLVDLAGSESSNDSINLTETKQINKSLLALTKVMTSLQNNDKFVNYRDSILTRLLEPQLKGKAKVLMFANIATSENCKTETIKALKFAAAVSSINLGASKRNVSSSNKQNQV